MLLCILVASLPCVLFPFLFEKKLSLFHFRLKAEKADEEGESQSLTTKRLQPQSVKILPKMCPPEPQPTNLLAPTFGPQLTLLLAPAPPLPQGPPPEPAVLEAALARTKKRRRVKEEERVYKRKKAHNVCRHCGQPKLKETGHKGFKGYSFCPNSLETYADFLNRVKALILPKKS